MISRSDLYRIKSRLGIREVVEHYGLRLQHNKCQCPFHQEKTASFCIHEKKQIFKCFGCGKGGDVIQFVREYLGCDFETAVYELNREFHLGLQLGQEINPHAVVRQSEEQKKQEIFLDWFSRTSFMLLMRYKQLKCVIDNEPISELSDVSDGFLYAINHIDFTEYILDRANDARTLSDKIEFYKKYHEEVIEIDGFRIP